MRATLAIFVLFISLAVGGCKGSSIVGKWKGSATAATDGSKDPTAGLAAGMASAMTIEFKADNTFDMSMIFPINGTWTQSGNTVTLTPKSVMGITPGANDNANNKPISFTLSGDGQTLTPQDAGDTSKGSIVFKRA